MLFGCFPARRDFPAQQRGCLVFQAHQEWQGLAFRPPRCQLGPVLTPLSLSLSGKEPSPSEQGLGTRDVLGHRAQLVCQEPVYTSLAAVGALDLFPRWFLGWGGLCLLPDGTFGSFAWRWSCAAGQHLARCSSPQQKACATCCHPGLEGMAWKRPSGASGGHCPPWGQIQAGGEAGASLGAGAGARLAVAASQPCRALFRWEQLAAGAFPAARFPRAPSQGCDSPGSPHRQGGWQRGLERALAPRCRAAARASRASGAAPVPEASLPAVPAWLPSLGRGEGAGAPVPAQAAAGRSWFALGAG